MGIHIRSWPLTKMTRFMRHLGHSSPMSFVAVYHSSAPNVRDPAEGVEMVGRKELGEFEDDNLRWAPSDVRCVLHGLLVWRGSGEKGVDHQ